MTYLCTWVWTEEAAVTSTLNTPLWLSTHFMPGSWTCHGVTSNSFNTQSQWHHEEKMTAGKQIFSLSDTHVRGEHGVARWRLFHRDRQTEGACAQSAMLHQRDPLRAERDTQTFTDGNTTERMFKQVSEWVDGCVKCGPAVGVRSRCSPRGSPEECSVWAGSWCGRRWTVDDGCLSDWRESSSSSPRRTRGTFRAKS